MAGPFIFVFTGTSGAGRKTIAHRIGSELGIYHVLSYTTRAQREKEKPDQDYRYISKESFDEMDRQGSFIQKAVISREYYGIRDQELERPLAQGKHVYLILNSGGASSIKKLYGAQVIRLFIYVDKITVRERLERKGMSFDVVERYMDQYTEEVVYRKQCEHVIENHEINKALEQIRTAIQSHL